MGKQNQKSPPQKKPFPLPVIIVATAIVIALVALLRPSADRLEKKTETASASKEGPHNPQAGFEEVDEEIFKGYAGSETCKECHKDAYDHWLQSNHFHAERPVSKDLDSDAFHPERSFKFGTQESSAGETNGTFHVTTKGFDNKVEAYQPTRAIGVEPLRQYLVETERGRVQTLELTFDPLNKEWFNVYGHEDRQPGEWGHWTGRGMTWNNMCAGCHNTRLRKNYDEKTDTYFTAMAEMSVGCESCHGPSKDHVDWQYQYKDSKQKDPTLKRLTRDQSIDTCGTCHSRRTELTGNFEPGDTYQNHFNLFLPNESEVYFADGQVNEEDYVFTSFLSSKMHAAGVRCMDCHQSHSTKLILPGNLLCMRCHSGGFPNSPVIDPAAHSHHDVNGPGGQCVNCHMPHTTYMQKHPRRDHGFTIPDPLLTKEFNIPNACNRCHQDKDVDWALTATKEWYGDRMERDTRVRARWIAKARQGDPAARPHLLHMLENEKMDFWKAVAAGILDVFAYDDEVIAALIRALEHESHFVRTQAASSLDPAVSSGHPGARSALEKLLEDDIRSVRVNAAWALRRSVKLDSQAGKDLLAYLNFNGDQPAGAMQQGAFYLDRGEVQEALTYYAKSVEWDPNSPPMRHELAVVLSMAGRTQEAVAQLEQAAQLDPNEAEYPYKLALAWNELGDTGKTLQYLEQATRINQQHPRAWYNLGIARSAAGDMRGAIDALVRAEGIQPENPEFPYARATIHAQMRQIPETIQAAQQALSIAPGHPGANALINQLRR